MNLLSLASILIPLILVICLLLGVAMVQGIEGRLGITAILLPVAAFAILGVVQLYRIDMTIHGKAKYELRDQLDGTREWEWIKEAK
jgi:NhaP-type Na+/H+ or K+/H+ antiporter